MGCQPAAWKEAVVRRTQKSENKPNINTKSRQIRPSVNNHPSLDSLVLSKKRIRFTSQSKFLNRKEQPRSSCSVLYYVRDSNYPSVTKGSNGLRALKKIFLLEVYKVTLSGMRSYVVVVSVVGSLIRKPHYSEVQISVTGNCR